MNSAGKGCGELVGIGLFLAILFGGSLLCFAATKAGEAVLPAEQTSWENIQPIQPKGQDGYEDKAWMEGDKALAEGNYWNAMATKTIAEAPVGVNPNTDGSMGSGIIIGAIGVVLLLGILVMGVGGGRK